MSLSGEPLNEIYPYQRYSRTQIILVKGSVQFDSCVNVGMMKNQAANQAAVYSPSRTARVNDDDSSASSLDEFLGNYGKDVSEALPRILPKNIDDTDDIVDDARDSSTNGSYTESDVSDHYESNSDGYSTASTNYSREKEGVSSYGLSRSFSDSSPKNTDNEIFSSPGSQDSRDGQMSDGEESFTGSYDGSVNYDNIEHSDTGDTDEQENLSVGSNDSQLVTMGYRLASNDPKLSEADIVMSSMTDTLANAIADALPANTNLKKLRLVFTSSEEIHYHNFSVLVDSVANNTSITTMEILHARMDRKASAILGAMFSRSRTVKKLCLTTCEFIASGLAILLVGLQHNTSIEDLVVKSCRLGSEEIDIVAASLQFMKWKCLVLEDINITLGGLRFLLDNLEKTEHLRELHLSNNKLGMKGVKLLASSLHSDNQTIEKIVLANCGLDQDDIGRLAHNLLENSTIKSIDLRGNEIGDLGALSLKALLEQNKKITELQLDGCKISEERMTLIKDRLWHNNSFLKSILSTEYSLAIRDLTNL